MLSTFQLNAFALLKTEAFSRNASKVFQYQSWYQRTVFPFIVGKITSFNALISLMDYLFCISHQNINWMSSANY